MKEIKEEKIVFADTIQKIKTLLKSIKHINAQYSEVAPYVTREDQLNRLLGLNISICKSIARVEKILRGLKPFLSSELERACSELFKTVQEEKEKVEDNIEDLTLCLNEEFRSLLEERLKNIVPPHLLAKFQKHKESN